MADANQYKRGRGSATWGAKLREVREAASLTRVALASKVACTPNTLSALECGRNRVSPVAFERLCEALPAVRALPGPPIGKNSGKLGSRRYTRTSTPTAKIKRLTVKRNPDLTAKLPRKKKGAPVSAGDRRLTVGLAASIFGLFHDRKALARIKGVLVAAAAEALTLSDLSRLLDAPAS